MSMKILLLFPMADGQTGPAIKHAFENLGHEVKAVDAKINPLTSYSIACDYIPDLVFCSRTVELTGQIAEIKEKFPDIITCMWNVDVRENIEAWKHLYPLIQLCDYHFVPDAGHGSQWGELNRNTFWLPQGLQDEVYDKPKEITDADRAKYSCDVSFAGGLAGGAHKHRGPYLDALSKMGINLKLWGIGLARRVYNEEHNKMVSLSKINLCCSYYAMAGQYSSVRNYKILGAGGFALELYREGIHELFPENVIKCYTTPEALVEKVRMWLGRVQERRAVAAAGYEWVHKNATYTHRIRMALDHMEIKQ